MYRYLTKPKRPIISLETPIKSQETKLETMQLQPIKPEEFKIEPVNVAELKKYIKDALNAKKPLATIKDELIKAGWDKAQVENELNIVSLRSYIQSKLAQGMKLEEVKESLKGKGWKIEQIEEAFKDIKVKPLF